MPTKEEILRSKKDEYIQECYSNGFNGHKLSTPILAAMEEYAKQEALAYSYWERNHSWECDYREERALSDDEYWHEYQQTKQIT